MADSTTCSIRALTSTHAGPSPPKSLELAHQKSKHARQPIWTRGCTISARLEHAMQNGWLSPNVYLLQMHVQVHLLSTTNS